MSTNVLENISPEQLGRVLQEARKKKGLTQADAAEIIEVGRTTMTAIEKGERRLKAGELIKLARAYGKQVSDLVSPRPEVQPFQVQFRAVLRRSEKDEQEVQDAIAELEELCRSYLELEEIVGSPLTKSYPPVYDVEGLPTDQAAESVAVAERDRLGIGSGPSPMLRDVFEQDVGLRIFYIEMPAKYSEIYTYDERLGGCMAANIFHPEERRRWSLAHGYAHFLAHRQRPTYHYRGQYQRMPESERFAEGFAMYFLMPTNGLLRRFNEIRRKNENRFTPANLCTLAHYYGVSVEALSRRLEDMGLLPTGTWEDLRERGFKVRGAQQELELEEIARRDDKTPTHYQHLALEALERGLITEGRFAQFLGVTRLEARHIANKLRSRSDVVEGDAGSVDLDLTQPRSRKAVSG